ncbi:MAG: DNA/RNA non-specific endonuclease, partial [Lachnospiraceae bacterium]|nr:DNA/RNA non-specific endonuclease [Lachnospiraceae bacterium]
IVLGEAASYGAMKGVEVLGFDERVQFAAGIVAGLAAGFLYTKSLSMLTKSPSGKVTLFDDPKLVKQGITNVDEISELTKLDDGLDVITNKNSLGVVDDIEGGTPTVKKVFTDNPFDENGNLKSNIKYQTGEFKYNYETDANGRISNWNTDNLQLTEREGRLNYNAETPGKEAGDHAGHLAGDRFGGSPELDNIVSQSQNVNLSQYKKIENQWEKAISEGKEVTVNVDIKYDGDGLRPIEFNVEYTIDGDFFSQSILN